jgi:hypothetical protein
MNRFLDVMTYQGDLVCKYQFDGLASDSETFVSFVNLFTNGKKRLLFVGDSLMANLYEALVCGIERLGVKTNKTFMGTYKWNGQIDECDSRCVCGTQSGPDSQGSLQRLDFESGGVLVSMLLYRIYWFGDHAGRQCTTSTTLIHDITGSYAIDHVFFNHAHHFQKPAKLANVWKMVGPLMSQWAHATGKHVSFVAHPPSHFATQTGQFKHHAPPESHECSCKIPGSRLIEQYVHVSNTIGASYAEEYGFDVIDYWDSLKSHCDKHPGNGDCLHYLLIPDIYAPAVRQIIDTLKK